MTQGSNWLHFFYDGQGQPAEMNFNGTVYIYVKNLQGDIVGIVDTTGRIVVEYKYDAWGRPIYSNSLVDSNSTLTARYALMLTLNPFRYRGYVYDVNSGLYYLRNRFYNPETERFINADKYVGSVGNVLCHNVFCYCKNVPVSKFDPDGCFDWKAIFLPDYLIGMLVAKAITKDEFGYTVMERWFNGFGKKLVIADDTKWNQFLANNDNFARRIIKHARNAVINGTYIFDVNNEWLSLDLSDHGEGDYSTGYGLINGTNSHYGGFCVRGTVHHIEGNKYHVVATYELNDYVDPGNYRLDWIYAVGSWFILGPCINYELQITGTVEFDFEYD